MPSTRPDIGGRPGVGTGAGGRPGGGPGISTLPAIGAGAAVGAGIANRVGDRPATLPGLGDGRPSQLPANRTPDQRRDDLNNRLTGENRPGQLPARDWNQVRNDWQQNRDDIRNDWQQHRDEARDDWQNWFDDHYSWYGGWYGGHAPGYWGRWDYLWDQYPVASAVGLTWWGANSMANQYGYEEYYNPYYVENTVVNYSEPVITVPVEAPRQQTGLPPGVSQDAIAKFDQATGRAIRRRLHDKGSQAHRRSRGPNAQRRGAPRVSLARAVRPQTLPRSRRGHSRRAGGWARLGCEDADQSLSQHGHVHGSSTKSGPGAERRKNRTQKDAAVHFLLGYHYLTCGYPDDALREFRAAADLQPKDSVTASLVATLAPRDAQPAQQPAAPSAVPAESVGGDWTAAGKGSAKYSMSLRKDGSFTWAFSRGTRKQEVKGVYTLEGNVLAMEPDTDGVMLAELKANGPDALHFKMIGGAKDEPGLGFHRGPSK